MNTSLISAPAEPPLSDVRPWLARLGAALWRVLEAIGQARAQPQLLALADRCEALRPGLARELRAASRRGPAF